MANTQWSSGNLNIFPFVKVEDPSVLIPILEKRYPKSAAMLNCIKIYQRLVGKHQVAFYALQGDVDESSWIVYYHKREGVCDDLFISADKEKSKVCREEAIEMLLTSKLFNWDESFILCGSDRWISSMVFEIITLIKGGSTSVIPCHLYYKDIEECLKLEVPSKLSNGVEIKKLDLETGSKFIMNTWKYASKCSFKDVNRSIEFSESGGIYVNDLPVCGVMTRAFGVLSALHTLPEHRKKGYASLAMKFAFKEQARNGLTPVTHVNIKNAQSILFHEKLECKIVCTVDYITYINSGF